MEHEAAPDIIGSVFSLDWSSIIRGAVLGLLLGIPLGLLLLPSLLPQIAAGLASPGESRPFPVVARAMLSDDVQLLSLLLACVAILCSGYWASRRAEFMPIHHGVWTGVVYCFAISWMNSLVFVGAQVALGEPAGAPSMSSEQWFSALSWVSIVSAGGLGGWIASQRAKAAALYEAAPVKPSG